MDETLDTQAKTQLTTLIREILVQEFFKVALGGLPEYKGNVITRRGGGPGHTPGTTPATVPTYGGFQFNKAANSSYAGVM